MTEFSWFIGRCLCLTRRAVQVARRPGNRVMATTISITTTTTVRLSDGVTENSAEWNSHVKMACDNLKANKIIAVPTDTIYGIAGLAQSPEAVGRIYQIKHRNMSNPVAICVSDVTDVKKWGQVTIPMELLKELLPGPVTVVFERTNHLNPHLNPGTSLVGVRVPDYGFVRDVVRACSEPIALTSANLSNAPSTLTINEFSDLWPQLAVVFDGGSLDHQGGVRTGSTVVDLSKTGLYTIIRPGSAHIPTIEKLERYGLKEDRKQ